MGGGRRMNKYFWMNLIGVLVAFGTGAYLGTTKNPLLLVPFALFGALLFWFMLNSLELKEETSK